ncbi:Flavin-dependent oxidoreductase, luciferase family (includes alkanesulfonate monooxygenase SsuD and methylene tetrahydromethanopterin reductase) [Sinosporangium album]|uniref:Flavin-dependent oxidoreductase, luciferase family (Includes alkanesulfonate monooxygenase SsuD and methylene tetrahydromethanopterin reductase) n=1 Tax=Sinosporangium album TaxID=504805 RepID=A0A1G8FNX8_9ACTN|nr:LLM class flavin-dependent oxidoreductase [Sinosporangium album]SDH83858.1 Flavin-dependent oxidoreductase, luciferase family (includes alkanesulfonate monooxygenase SsuD and methylene tetrahydromethanopterin reductase) [Sinosporangium album]
MEIGLFHSIQWPKGSAQPDRYNQALYQAQFVEELGFDSVWFTEHHFSRHGIVSNSLAVLANLAARTERIRLGTAVTVLPLHDPVRLAETVATVDILSGGRLDLGIGSGYQAGEFSGYGLDIADKHSRFDESLEVLRRIWTEDQPFTHEGEHWRYLDCYPQPRPMQQPHPPIWLATDGPQGMATCASNDWGVLLPQGASWSKVGEKVATYQDALTQAGKSVDDGKLWLARGFYTAATTEKARAEATGPYIDFLTLAGQLAGPKGLPGAGGRTSSPDELDAKINDTAIFGSPEDCIESFIRARELGVRRIMLFVHMGQLQHQQILDSLALFGKEVLPVVKDL